MLQVSYFKNSHVDDETWDGSFAGTHGPKAFEIYNISLMVRSSNNCLLTWISVENFTYLSR